MDKNQAVKLLKETFENPFDKDRYTVLVKSIFKDKIELTPQTKYQGNLIKEAYEEYIQKLERIGKYTDNDGKRTDVLIIHLKKETSLERARTMQRNFVAAYLNGSRGGTLIDAALVAFISPDSEDWRFSLVRMDYKIDTTGKSLKAVQELTPAKRYSFLVGKNENSHTAQRQILPKIQDDDTVPALSQLEQVFNIEVVTKEFFAKYRDLFQQINESLESVLETDKSIKTEFKDKGINTTDFSKKLLGQIVFLYFLQKKGWFGVERDKTWGTGSKVFLRELFDKKHSLYDNFFNDILEPLFYEALSTDRGPSYYWNKLKCRIPFLNGGLFEPINGYSWETTDIRISNELFSNDNPTKEGDKGTGILDIFDRYNFTVKEDEPLEKEVAIDPEMLGKVFENLLEVKDRKSKGTYYTPREIVHYMCQESLINYLLTNTSSPLRGEDSGEGDICNAIPKEDLQQFIKYSELAIEHEEKILKQGKETRTYKHKISENIRTNAELIDKKLSDIKVCDPACGSGAFLVGMMIEIVRARRALTTFLYRHSERSEESRSIYTFKLHAIHESLYGVDIDSSAVEIAKLRLWLSLVVDEDDMKNIKPLPNLDYKIMQGNSLIEEYEGIKLFDEKLIFQNIDNNTEQQKKQTKDKIKALENKYVELDRQNKLTKQGKLEIHKEIKHLQKIIEQLDNNVSYVADDLFNKPNQSKEQAEKLKSLHKQFFEEAHKTEKENLRKQIEELEWDLIETTLKEQNKLDALNKLTELKKSNSKPYFLWKLNFSEVFEKGGFDVVLANPPYINIENIPVSDKREYLKLFTTAKKRFDIYNLFVEKSLDVCHINGFVTVIIPYSICNQDNATELRKLILLNKTVVRILDARNIRLFENALVNNIVLFVKNQKQLNPIIKIDRLNSADMTIKYCISSINQDKQKGNYEYMIRIDYDIKHSQLFDKIESKSIRVADIAIASWGARGVPVSDFHLSKAINKYCKPMIKGKNIQRYFARWDNLYLLYDISKLYRPAFVELFESEKICIQKVTGKEGIVATYDSEKYYTDDSICDVIMKYNLVGFSDSFLNRRKIIIDDASIEVSKQYKIKYILGIINSNLVNYYYKTKLGYDLNIYPEVIEQLPVFKADIMSQQNIVVIVDKILGITKNTDYLQNTIKLAKVKAFEDEIDQLVYKLYNLTDEEIGLVESGDPVDIK